MESKRYGKKRKIGEITAIKVISKKPKGRKGYRKKSYKRKPKFSKRYGRSRKGITPNQLNRIINKPCLSTIANSLGYNSGLNPVHYCKQRVYKEITFTGNGSSTNELFNLKVNSTFDPFNDSGATQAPGRDVLIGVYKTYIVLGAKVWWRVRQDSGNISTAATEDTRSFADVFVTSDQATTLAQAKDRGLTTTYLQGYDSDRYTKMTSKMVKKYINPRYHMDANGPGQLLAEVGVASAGSDPTALCRYAGIIKTVDDGFVANLKTVVVDVWITQYVAYFGFQSAIEDS